MDSHWSFGHLQPKLWAKEGPGVKLAVWLPTSKSQEVTCYRRVLWKCDMALESSLRRLQVWFRPRPDQRLGWGATKSQSPKVPGVQTGTVSGLHFGSPGKKSHLDATPVGERREYYREYGGGISRARAVVCHVRDQIAWSLPSLIPELPTRPLYPF
jgi:hypothetical protein